MCETEREAMAEVLGTHVQRLATIVNGDCACTTHVPLSPTSHQPFGAQPAPKPPRAPRSVDMTLTPETSLARPSH